jgi:hypothetical protein
MVSTFSTRSWCAHVYNSATTVIVSIKIPCVSTWPPFDVPHLAQKELHEGSHVTIVASDFDAHIGQVLRVAPKSHSDRSGVECRG